jgi:outer membrane protein OmpA-like peptidoglycan-associated protein
VLRRTPFTVKLVDSATNEMISSSLIEINEENSNDNSIIDSSQKGIFNELLYNKTSYILNINADKYIPKTISIVTNDSLPEIIIPVHKIKTDFLVEGNIINKSTKDPIPQSNIIIIDLLTKDTVYNKIVDEDGKFSFSSIKNNKLYYIDIYKEGYLKNPGMLLNTLNESAETEIEKMGDYIKKIELSEIVIGKSIKIENIYFDLDKYNIRPDAAIELDKIVSLMKNNPNLIIELGSHTDCRSSFDYNMKLSNNRAKSSVAYIVSNGISKNRISAKGYGETMLVNDCKCDVVFDIKACNEEQHQANRRTEFKITGLLKDKNTIILNNGMGNSPKSVPLPKY